VCVWGGGGCPTAGRRLYKLCATFVVRFRKLRSIANRQYWELLKTAEECEIIYWPKMWYMIRRTYQAMI